MDLYAWVGLDEHGSGEVGLKQGLTPAGLIPLVAIKREKMTQQYLTAQLQRQASTYGVTIRLVKFTEAETVMEIKP